MAADPDSIADCVLETFDQLPDKRKPRAPTDVAREWVPLAGIVVADKDGKLSCISLGTGMKCLPANKLALARGNALHDWHAEVLAIRAFNRFLLDELLLTLTPPYPPSTILRQRSVSERTPTHPHPYTLKEGIKLYMYCSEAPCGDASMELTMALQEDATPWTSPVPMVSSPLLNHKASTPPDISPGDHEAKQSPSALRGRSHFSHLGAVRCKPSRPDAPPTLSKSCSDKLALVQATSLLSALPSTLVSPSAAYLTALVLPASQHIPAAVSRAFSSTGRMKNVPDVSTAWEAGYRFQPFEVQSTTREFAWSRRAVPAGAKASPSNLSAVWTPGWQETLIGGVLQGRKQFDPRGASAICRRSMWRLTAKVVAGVVPALGEALGRVTYAGVKESELLEARRRVKHDVRREGLKGWVKNSGDDEWGIEGSSVKFERSTIPMRDSHRC